MELGLQPEAAHWFLALQPITYVAHEVKPLNPSLPRTRLTFVSEGVSFYPRFYFRHSYIVRLVWFRT